MQVVIISKNEHEKRRTELKHMQIRLILEGAGEYLERMCAVRERRNYRFNNMDIACRTILFYKTDYIFSLSPPLPPRNLRFL